MAAKNWESDFRYPAMQLSVKLVRNDQLDEPMNCPFSFCVPVAENPVTGVTPGRISALFLVLGFLGLIAGVVLVEFARNQPGMEPFILSLALTCSISGVLCFFLPVKLDRYIVRWILGERGADLLERGRGEIVVAELSQADQSHMEISVDGDDYVMAFFDSKNRQILIEGISARYKILETDARRLRPFEDINYIGVEVTYLIGSQIPLRIAIARVSMLKELIRQLPVLSFLKRYVRNRLLDKAMDTFTVLPIES